MNVGQMVHGSVSGRPKEAILGTGYELLIDSATTGGAYELMKFVVPPMLGPPKHVHENEDEHYYFIEGEFEVTVGSETFDVGPGSYLHLPRNVPHGLSNIGESNGSFLCWVIPGNLGKLFDMFKKPWPEDQKSPPLLTQDDIRKMSQAADEYGIRMVV